MHLFSVAVRFRYDQDNAIVHLAEQLLRKLQSFVFTGLNGEFYATRKNCGFRISDFGFSDWDLQIVDGNIR